MVDEIHRKGPGTGISDEESPYYAGGPQTAKRHSENELFSASGLIASFSHRSLQDQLEEKEKRDDSRRFLRALLYQSFIDDLERRNEELGELIREAEDNLREAEKEREEILPKLKDAERNLTTCENDRHVTRKIIEEIQQKETEAQALEWDALKALPDEVLPDNLVQITFDVHNGDRPNVVSVVVAVYQENGKYYFINPVTEQPQEVIDEKQKAELDKQLKEGRNTYDTESDDMKHRIEHLHEAAHNLIVHALHVDEHEAELEKAKVINKIKEDDYEEQLNRVRTLTKQLQAKDDQIKDIKDKIALSKDELEENKIKLTKLYKEREELQVSGQQAQSQLGEEKKERDQSHSERQDIEAKYLEALKAQDDYSKSIRETWENYQDCKKDERALREMGVAMVEVLHHDPAHPDSHAHMVHTVHRDGNGYYYLNADDQRQGLDSIKPGTKAVEDLSGNAQVKEAVRLYDQKADKFHTTLHEYEKLNKDAESLAQAEQERKKPRSASDITFDNEQPIAPSLTKTGIFSDAAGQPYTEPQAPGHGHAPAVIPPKNSGPAT